MRATARSVGPRATGRRGRSATTSPKTDTSERRAGGVPARARQAPAAIVEPFDTFRWEAWMGKFVLGFVVALVLVIFLIVQCTKAIF